MRLSDPPQVDRGSFLLLVAVSCVDQVLAWSFRNLSFPISHAHLPLQPDVETTSSAGFFN